MVSRDFTYIVDGVIKVIDKPSEWNAKDPEIKCSYDFHRRGKMVM